MALSIDLIWGYCGILSLGHGAFFALGGYAMGMYLMRQIGTRGVYAHPVLPDFMVFLNWPELPIYWYGFQHFAYAAFMVSELRTPNPELRTPNPELRTPNPELQTPNPERPPCAA